MKTMIYHIGSVTHAVRGQKALERNGIRAYVHRQSEPGIGCGYSLWVSTPDRAGQETAKRLLYGAGIPINKEEERAGMP